MRIDHTFSMPVLSLECVKHVELMTKCSLRVNFEFAIFLLFFFSLKFQYEENIFLGSLSMNTSFDIRRHFLESFMSNEQILKKLQHVQVLGQQAQGPPLTSFSMATRSEEIRHLEPRQNATLDTFFCF